VAPEVTGEVRLVVEANVGGHLASVVFLWI
jgi:hypothetical protein